MGFEQWHVANSLKILFLGHFVTMNLSAGGPPSSAVLPNYTKLLLETNAEKTGLYWNSKFPSIIQ